MDIRQEKRHSYVDDIHRDIQNYLNDFPNRNYGIRCLAKYSELNEKTIKRIIEGQSIPSYQSIFKLYTVFLNTCNEEEIIANVSPEIADILKKSNPKALRKSVHSQVDLYQIFKTYPLAGEIFILAGTQAISLNAIAYRYGQYGVEILEKMVKEDILIEVNSREYQLNSNLPHLDGKTIKELGLRLTQTFSDPEKSHEMKKNVLSIYAEALNQAGIEEWLKIDTDAFRQKVAIAKQKEYQGHIPYFTFSVSDNLSLGKK